MIDSTGIQLDGGMNAESFKNSAAGRYLISCGITPAGINSYSQEIDEYFALFEMPFFIERKKELGRLSNSEIEAMMLKIQKTDSPRSLTWYPANTADYNERLGQDLVAVKAWIEVQKNSTLFLDDEQIFKSIIENIYIHLRFLYFTLGKENLFQKEDYEAESPLLKYLLRIVNVPFNPVIGPSGLIQILHFLSISDFLIERLTGKNQRSNREGVTPEILALGMRQHPGLKESAGHYLKLLEVVKEKSGPWRGFEMAVINDPRFEPVRQGMLYNLNLLRDALKIADGAKNAKEELKGHAQALVDIFREEVIDGVLKKHLGIGAEQILQTTYNLLSINSRLNKRLTDQDILVIRENLVDWKLFLDDLPDLHKALRNFVARNPFNEFSEDRAVVQEVAYESLVAAFLRFKEKFDRRYPGMLELVNQLKADGAMTASELAWSPEEEQRAEGQEYEHILRLINDGGLKVANFDPMLLRQMIHQKAIRFQQLEGVKLLVKGKSYTVHVKTVDPDNYVFVMLDSDVPFEKKEQEFGPYRVDIEQVASDRTVSYISFQHDYRWSFEEMLPMAEMGRYLQKVSICVRDTLPDFRRNGLQNELQTLIYKVSPFGTRVLSGGHISNLEVNEEISSGMHYVDTRLGLPLIKAGFRLESLKMVSTGWYTGYRFVKIADNPAESKNIVNDPGGIDLNPAQMSMRVNKEGEDFKFDYNSAPIDAATVTGAAFTIRQMTPVTNLLQILGFSP